MSQRSRRSGLRTGRRDWLWAIAAITIVGVAIVSGFVMLSGGSGSTVKVIVSGVECERGERLDYHVHSHLTLIVEGDEVPVTGNIGIRTDCIFWLHTHSTDGILHVEAPEQRGFTLGHFPSSILCSREKIFLSLNSSAIFIVRFFRKNSHYEHPRTQRPVPLRQRAEVQKMLRRKGCGRRKPAPRTGRPHSTSKQPLEHAHDDASPGRQALQHIEHRR